MSTFSNIELGKKGIMTHQTAIGVTGNNIANLNTEGYSRQKIKISTFDPLAKPGLNRSGRAGQIGEGPKVDSIKRVRDKLLETRIIDSAHEEEFWKTRDSYLLKLDNLYNEPSDVSLRSMMDNFWSSFQELSLFPEQMSSRQVVLERAETMADGISTRYKRLNLIRTEASEDIELTTKKVNSLAQQIAELNKQVKESKAVGDSPNEIMDKRDLLVNELSTYLSITVTEKDDIYNVHTQGFHLIVDDRFRQLKLGDKSDYNEGYPDLYWADNGDKFNPKGGKLESLFIIRDVDVKEEIQSLDSLAMNLVNLTNNIHREGYSLSGHTNENFFVEFPFVDNAQGNYDSNGDGNYDSTRISTIIGSNKLKPQDHIGVEGTMSFPVANGPDIKVAYHPTDTVRDILIRINNSNSEVTASLDHNGHLMLKGAPSSNVENPDFVIRSFTDDSDFLAGYSGILQNRGDVYDYNQADATKVLQTSAKFGVAPDSHPSAYLRVSKNIKEDASNIAASSKANTMGNGEIALKLASLRNTEVMVGRIRNFDDYFVNSVAKIGSSGQEAKLISEEKSVSMKYLKDLRDSISGVSLDEELNELLKFQHGYNASARFVTVADGLLDTIINKLMS